MLNIGLALFLVAHGLVHSILAIAPTPSDPDATPGTFFTAVERSWLLPQLGLAAPTIRWIGLLLVALSTLGFILAGLGILGVPGLSGVWRSIAVVSSSGSLLLLILFWHPWLIIGVLIDIGILVSLLIVKWPPIAMISS